MSSATIRLMVPSSRGHPAAVAAERCNNRQRSPLIHGQHAGMNGCSNAPIGVFRRGICLTQGRRENAPAWYRSGPATRFQLRPNQNDKGLGPGARPRAAGSERTDKKLVSCDAFGKPRRDAPQAQAVTQIGGIVALVRMQLGRALARGGRLRAWAAPEAPATQWLPSSRRGQSVCRSRAERVSPPSTVLKHAPSRLIALS